MTLSIIIPTHNRPEQAAILLESIARQDFSPQDLQVLLISNLRDKILRKRVSYWKRQFFDFKYKEVGLVGVNKARNMGIRFAGGEILYFLDDDCILPNKSHLKNLVLRHKAQASVMGIGGGYRASEGFLYDLDRFYHEHSEKWVKDHVVEDKSASQLIGGNASYKREVFDKGFYFDPLIAFGGSEESFNESLREESWTLVYDRELWVFHVVRLTMFSLIKKSFWQGFNSFEREHAHSGKEKWEFLKKEWAFSFGSFSFYSFTYNLGFKLGYLWGASFSKKKNFIFKFIYFIFLIFKSRFYFVKEYLFPRLYGCFFEVVWQALVWIRLVIWFHFFKVIW